MCFVKTKEYIIIIYLHNLELNYIKQEKYNQGVKRSGRLPLAKNKNNWGILSNMGVWQRDQCWAASVSEKDLLKWR